MPPFKMSPTKSRCKIGLRYVLSKHDFKSHHHFVLLKSWQKIFKKKTVCLIYLNELSHFNWSSSKSRMDQSNSSTKIYLEILLPIWDVSWDCFQSTKSEVILLSIQFFTIFVTILIMRFFTKIALSAKIMNRFKKIIHRYLR